MPHTPRAQSTLLSTKVIEVKRWAKRHARRGSAHRGGKASELSLVACLGHKNAHAPEPVMGGGAHKEAARPKPTVCSNGQSGGGGHGPYIWKGQSLGLSILPVLARGTNGK